MSTRDVVRVRIDLERVKARIGKRGAQQLPGEQDKLAESFLSFLGFEKREPGWYEVREARLIVLDDGEILERQAPRLPLAPPRADPAAP